MKKQDEIKELFSEKLGNFQAPVNPDLWANISAQLTSGVTTAATGISVAAKTLIGLSVAAVVTVGVIIIVNTPQTNNKNQASNTPQTTINTVDNEPLLTEGEAEIVSKKESGKSNVTIPFTTNAAVKDTKNETNTTATNVNVNTLEVVVDVNEAHEEKIIEEATIEENIIVDIQNLKETTDEELISDVPEKEEQKSEPIRIKLFNVFTPNGDLDNDFLYVENENLTDFNVVVINSQNNVVFQSNDRSFKWDGTGMNGSPVPAGNYVYFITAIDTNGNAVNEHSSLTIVR